MNDTKATLIGFIAAILGLVMATVIIAYYVEKNETAVRTACFQAAQSDTAIVVCKLAR